MRGSYYVNSFKGFYIENESLIRDTLTSATSKNYYQQLSTQTESWSTFIRLLKFGISNFNDQEEWGVLLEYPIPRRSKRIDAVLIIEDIIVVIEFKDGKADFNKEYILQVEDYCLDLRDFHLESKGRLIIPILFCHNAKAKENFISERMDNVQSVLFANKDNLNSILINVIKLWTKRKPSIKFSQWNRSEYMPTPSIIEAAQALYAGHNVNEITRSHSGAENLSITTNAVLSAINEAKQKNSKIICFITGVPGAGKTLAGLNVIHNRNFSTNENDIGVFLSGNSPLIKVLTVALALDVSTRENITKREASREISTFIHNVHQFIDEHYFSQKPPPDRVLVYDEAQRAWTKAQKFRKSKGKINESEPEILLSIMNRFKDSWAVIIALVGLGQEINKGEGGLKEWGKALRNAHSNWNIYISPELTQGNNGSKSILFESKPSNLVINENPSLNLKVSTRSYKAQELSDWVNYVLNNQPLQASKLFTSHLNEFPIFVTRSLFSAKKYLKSITRGTRRSGILATSGAKRLRAIGLDVAGGLKGTSSPEELGAWYLNKANDVRSSNFLEVINSEFGVQGLELDSTCVCWDADLRRIGKDWQFRSFKGSRWTEVNIAENQQFILNKYRVLLTRAREGMIIYIPEGDNSDITRLVEYYDPIYNYIKSCGVFDFEVKGSE